MQPLGFELLKSSVADPDPGSGIQCFLDPLTRGRVGMGKKSRSGSGMNIPWIIFPRAWNGNNFFGKILACKFFAADPEPDLEIF